METVIAGDCRRFAARHAAAVDRFDVDEHLTPKRDRAAYEAALISDKDEKNGAG